MKREKLAQSHDIEVEAVCCKGCERASEKEKGLYCHWMHAYVEAPIDDYCVYFLPIKKD